MIPGETSYDYVGNEVARAGGRGLKNSSPSKEEAEEMNFFPQIKKQMITERLPLSVRYNFCLQNDLMIYLGR